MRGVVYFTDSEQNKVVAYTTAGVYFGQWGTAGSKPGQPNNPSGITHDVAGLVYVADAGNDRVQVFDPTTALAADSSLPSVVITGPAAEATVPAPVTLTGRSPTTTESVRSRSRCRTASPSSSGTVASRPGRRSSSGPRRG